jgi:4-amino-4-deoxy-L-arabinose transferase-like glycosyltransferase
VPNADTRSSSTRVIPSAYREPIGIILGVMVLLLVGLWNLDAAPPWWDEGWTLSVARNLVEQGIYGRLLNGMPAPPGLEASLLVTGPVSIAMRVFGVGLWQGRIFGVICATVALILLWWLTSRLYNRRIAIGAVAVALLLTMHPQLHILIQGRRVLGEVPMFAYMLAGYACLLLALQQQSVWIVPSMLCFALTRLTKAQALPFLTIALAVPLIVALLTRRWRFAALLALALSGPILVAPQINAWFWRSLSPSVVPGYVESEGLLNVTGLVLTWFNRRYAVINALTFGLPTLLGLITAAWSFLRRPTAWIADGPGLLRLSLLTLAGSWFAWFLLLSVGVPRYMFPPVFLGTIFVSACLDEWTVAFNPRETLHRSMAALGLRDRRNFASLLALLLIVAGLPLSLLAIQRFYFADDQSARAVARYFNTQTPPDTLIETYESELHFFLDRPYHYPPDQVHVELNQRSLLQSDILIDYDPLAVDPDYLVIGRFSRGNDLYEPTLQSGIWTKLFSAGDYDVYERAHP